MVNVSKLITTELLLQSTPHCKVNWIEVLTIPWPVFWVDKLWYESAVKQIRDVNVALVAITPSDTTALAKDIQPMCQN